MNNVTNDNHRTQKEIERARGTLQSYEAQRKTIELMGDVDTCVACGEYVPEGRQVCITCEARFKV